MSHSTGSHLIPSHDALKNEQTVAPNKVPFQPAIRLHASNTTPLQARDMASKTGPAAEGAYFLLGTCCCCGHVGSDF